MSETCPSDETLAAFLGGRLSAPGQAARAKPHWKAAQQTLSSIRARREQVAGR
jgi:hypothetical protein